MRVSGAIDSRGDCSCSKRGVWCLLYTENPVILPAKGILSPRVLLVRGIAWTPRVCEPAHSGYLYARVGASGPTSPASAPHPPASPLPLSGSRHYGTHTNSSSGTVENSGDGPCSYSSANISLWRGARWRGSREYIHALGVLTVQLDRDHVPRGIVDAPGQPWTTLPRGIYSAMATGAQPQKSPSFSHTHLWKRRASKME